MTSEELQDEARHFVGMVESDIATRLRYVITNAYLEAARTIQAQCNAKGTGCLAHCTHPESIAAVRALADSIGEGEK